MAVLTAAMKRDPARQLAQNLLSPLNHMSKTWTTPDIGEDFSFKVDLDVELVLDLPPGERYSIDIVNDGTITAFCRIDVYVRAIEFDFAVNKVWRAGVVQWICLQKIAKKCVVYFPVIMPRLPSVRFRIDLHRFGIDRIPLMSFNPTFAVEDFRTAERIDADNLQLVAKLSLLSVGAFMNYPAFVQNVVNVLFRVVSETLERIPVLGNVIRYFDRFIEQIVDFILNAAHFVASWENFVDGHVRFWVADLIKNFFDPTVDIKVARVPGRKMISPPVSTADHHTEPALYANFNSMSLDVNTGCPSGPELRARVEVS